MARSKIGRLDGDVLSSDVILKKGREKIEGGQQTNRSGREPESKERHATNLVGTEHVLVEDVHSDLDESGVSDPSKEEAREQSCFSFVRGEQTREETRLTFHRVQR